MMLKPHRLYATLRFIFFVTYFVALWGAEKDGHCQDVLSPTGHVEQLRLPGDDKDSGKPRDAVGSGHRESCL